MNATAPQNGFEGVRAHPADLEKAGVRAGEVAELFNASGITLVSISADPGVTPGFVVRPTVSWFGPVIDAAGRQADLGGNPNSRIADPGSSTLSRGNSANHSRAGLRPLRDPGLLVRPRARSTPSGDPHG